MDEIRAAVAALEDELVEIRRDLHAHPELSWHEERTTGIVADRLTAAGVPVQLLPKGGLVADLGTDGPMVALRADLDALPVDDRTTDPWVSTVDGVAHACGHDVHTTALLGAGLALAARGGLPGRVRLLFQPAEEVMPGGALEMIAGGLLDEVRHVFAVHCDPTVDVGHIGLREGPITGAADMVTVRLSGNGGHTSRPHLTQDLTYALGALITQLPAALSRRLDPRTGASVVWGTVRAGAASNVIPASGELGGTVRMLDAVAWAEAEGVVRSLIDQLVAPYGVTAEVTYLRGVPPVVNGVEPTALLARAARNVVGPTHLLPTPQSLGGEDFGWYVDTIPGAMARLGTRTPGGPLFDLHRGDLRIDELAVTVGAELLATVAVEALADIVPGPA